MIHNVPLPGMPEGPPGEPAARVHLQRYKPRHRLMCGDCMVTLHLLGDAAPAPRLVRWLVTEGSLTRHLCDEHKSKRSEGHL